MATVNQPVAAAPERRGSQTARRAADLALRFHLPLVGIYAIAAAVAIDYGLKVDTWKVMSDELQYVRLALSFGEDGTIGPRIHGEFYGGYSLLYPWMLAPLYWAFDAPKAFELAHVVNGLAMASAVFPAYLIARMAGLSRGMSYLGGALCVAVPWLTMTTLVFTEPVAYPAFLWGVAGIQFALGSPGARGDLLALGGVLLAFSARTQFIFLAALLPLAIVLHELGMAVLARPRPPLRETLLAALRSMASSHRVLIAAYVVGALGVLALVDGGFRGLLGSYSEATSGDLLPPGTPRASALNVVLISLGVGLFPAVLAAGWAVTALLRPPDRREHALAVVLVLVVPVVAVMATSYNFRYQLGFSQERYLFYLAPLLLLGMLVCLAGRARPWLGVLAAGGLAYWLLEPADLSPSDPPLFASPAAFYYRVLDGRVYELGQKLGFNDLSHETVIMVALVVGTIALAAALRFLPKARVAAVVGLAVLAYGAVETRYLFPRAAEATTGGALADAYPLDQRDWIDKAVPDDADVWIAPGQIGPDAFYASVLWWGTEMFNKRVTDSFFVTGSTVYTPFSAVEMTLDPRTGRLRTTAEPPYLVVPVDYIRFRPAGRTVAVDPQGVLALVEAGHPYRADWASFGVDVDRWTLANPRIRFYADPDRRLTERRVAVTLELAPTAPRRRYRLTGGSSVQSGTIAGTQVRTEVVCMSVPRGSTRDLHIETTRTASGDGRRVGVRIARIEDRPLPPGGCRATR